MNDSSTSIATRPPAPINRWTARIGLVIVATILVTSFGLLIAASAAAQ